MKSKSIFLTISLISSVCFGQSSFSYGSSSSELFEVTKKINSVKSYNNNLGDIVGSAYMNDEFQSGVIFKNSESDGSWFIRYNAYNDDEIQKIQKDAVSAWSEKKTLEEAYFDEGKHKNSLKYLRAILFYCQRAEHMSGPSPNYEDLMKQIIADIRNLLSK